jgi:hypothetical protein
MAESAAQKFALFCEENGWEAERQIVNSKDDHKKVIATSPEGAVVTAEWISGAALGPAIGHYTPPGENVAIPIKNQASARRIIDGTQVPSAPKPRPKKDPNEAPKPRRRREEGEAPREITPNIDWDPYEITDDDLLAILPGKTITWQNQYGYESGNVPPLEIDVEILDKKNNKTRKVRKRNPSIFISESQSKDTEGERIFNFCDPVVGFRATFIAAIVRIG